MAEMTKIRTERFMGDHALRVVLDAPKANILDGEMMGQINALLDELKDEAGLKLICFCGEGKHFSFGASVEEHVGERAAQMLDGFHGMFLRMAELGVFTAAAVSGRCLGGGMELAAFCNRVVAHPEAVFAQPEIQLAVLPPIASLILPLKVGQSRADDINVTGRNVLASEAREMGLVDELAEEPVVAVEQWAERELAAKSASSLRIAVKASRWHFNHILCEQIKPMERFYLETLMKTHDANEGLAAFLDRRKPDFTHS